MDRVKATATGLLDASGGLSYVPSAVTRAYPRPDGFRTITHSLPRLMPQLDDVLSRIKTHEGVEHIFLLGGDGLLVRHIGEPRTLEVDTVAAMVPGLGAACASLGRVGELGAMSTAVIEFARGVVIVVALSKELILAIVVRPGIGFSALLRDLRQERAALANLV
jgi:predicted regulator of Ras-like GTPase activity (Roadblock/LC7/MglB family)